MELVLIAIEWLGRTVLAFCMLIIRLILVWVEWMSTYPDGAVAAMFITLVVAISIGFMALGAYIAGMSIVRWARDI